MRSLHLRTLVPLLLLLALLFPFVHPGKPRKNKARQVAFEQAQERKRLALEAKREKELRSARSNVDISTLAEEEEEHASYDQYAFSLAGGLWTKVARRAVRTISVLTPSYLTDLSPRNMDFYVLIGTFVLGVAVSACARYIGFLPPLLLFALNFSIKQLAKVGLRHVIDKFNLHGAVYYIKLLTAYVSYLYLLSRLFLTLLNVVGSLIIAWLGLPVSWNLSHQAMSILLPGWLWEILAFVVVQLAIRQLPVIQKILVFTTRIVPFALFVLGLFYVKQGY